MKGNNWIHVVVLVLLLGVTGLQCARRTFPADNGGYDIVVAIEKGTIEPTGVCKFLQSIETSLQEFSNLMHSATNGMFHIKSAKVIIPYHWELTNCTGGMSVAFLENYNNADIRLSRVIKMPHVENPTACGSPGAYINLPLEFFNANPETSYGQPSKVLLTAWARYRWGTWEEHGYPGDSKFPYFYKDLNAGWQPTGCSDVQLNGAFTSINDPTGNLTNCEPDTDTDSLYPPAGECRFQPEQQNQTASSSLSYFPWLPDIDSFCTENTHNADAPNKQNLYCGYKSVFEVIENSEDSEWVTSPEATLPSTMEIHVERENRKPLFYLLVDTGRFLIPREVYEDIIAEISSFYSQEALQGMIGKAAVFPTNQTDVALEEQFSWTRVDERLEDFIATTNLSETVQSEDPGSFAVALHQVIDELRSIRNPTGAVVLVLKHGFTEEAFGNVYESEMVSILQTNKITLHALEIRENIITPKLNLKRLSTESGGEYLAINPTASVAGQVSTFVSKIIDQLEAGKSVEHKAKPLFAGFLDVQDAFQIPLQTANFPNGTKINFALTLPRSSVDLPTDTWISVIEPGNITISMLPNEYEWNEPSDGSSRLVVRNEMNFPFGKLGDDDWRFQYSGCIPEDACKAYVVVSYELPEGENYSFDNDGLNLEIYINSDSLPVLIYAKITENSQPVIGLHSVKATVTNFESQQTIFSVPLQDNGPNAVDIMNEDGVYSGYFLPPEDGQYVITVTVSGHRATRDFLVDHLHRDSAIQSFLPVNQTTVGCPSTVSSCGVTGLSKSVLQLSFYPEVVNVEMVSNLEGQIGRIIDLDAVAMEEFMIKLTWTVPPISANSSTPGLIYDIRSSGNATHLRDLDSFETAPNADIVSNCDIFEQGQLCSAMVTDSRTSPVYFALRLNTSTIMTAEPSNVVGVVPSSKEPSSTTTTTTTIAPPTTSTARSTTSTSSTTTEDPSKVNTTTTTTEPPSEYWYETTEGKWTLGLFGAGVALIFISVGAYALFKQFLGKRQGSDDTEQLQEMF